MKKDPRQPTPEPEPGNPAGPPPAAGTEGSPGDQAGAQNLTPEEQMALFEKHLKENDWGHRPC